MALADEGSFSAAAQFLMTVQSNVSAHVARLETELGVTVFDRTQAVLTEEGHVVVARARRVMGELESLRSELAGMGHRLEGTVRMGMIGTTARWLGPLLLEAVSRRHPDVRLVLVEGTTTSLSPQLINGAIDLAVVNFPVPAELDGRLLFEEDLVLVVEKSDPLARRSSVGLAELVAVPLLLPIQGTAFRQELDSALRVAGLSLLPRAEVDGVRLIATLTFEGLGPAILPATAVPQIMRAEWHLLPVNGIPRRHVGVARRRRSLPSAPARALLELLQEEIADPAKLPSGLHPVGPAELTGPPPARSPTVL